MAYARYPNLRNYKKRCELETMIFNLRALRNAQAAADEAAWEKAFAAGASSTELDDIEAAENTRRDKINAKIEAVMTIQASLEFPATKNQWFTEIVSEKGIGTHNITDRQYECFLQYCERDPSENRSAVVHRCRVGDYFVSLNSAIGGKWMEISAIPDIRDIIEVA